LLTGLDRYHFAEFLDREVATGRYRTASEAVPFDFDSFVAAKKL